MTKLKLNQILPGLVAAPAGLALVIGMLVFASPAQANSCAEVCEYTMSCFEMNARIYLEANPNDADARQKWEKFQRQKKRASRNCIKSCGKFENAAVACYKKSGGEVSAGSCAAATHCLKPYIKQ